MCSKKDVTIGKAFSVVYPVKSWQAKKKPSKMLSNKLMYGWFGKGATTRSLKVFPFAPSVRRTTSSLLCFLGYVIGAVFVKASLGWTGLVILGQFDLLFSRASALLVPGSR